MSDETKKDVPLTIGEKWDIDDDYPPDLVTNKEKTIPKEQEEKQ